MKTILDTLDHCTVPVEHFEQENEIKAVLNALQEATHPDRSMTEMRIAAADMTEIADIAFPIDVRDLLDSQYSSRAITTVDGDVTRTDFATREFDETSQQPGEKLNGWFTMLETAEGTEMRYAFSARDAWSERGGDRPYAVTFRGGECSAVAMVYQRGRYQEVEVRDPALTKALIAEAFFNIFLATQRMETRTDAERSVANNDAKAKLDHALRARMLGKQLGDDPRSMPNAQVAEADGISWIVPEKFSD